MVAAVAIGTPEWSPDRIVADTPWRHQKLLAGGGATLDIGVHLAHRLRYLAGEVRTMTAVTRVFEPQRMRRDGAGRVVERVNADVDDAFFALPQFATGATGTLSFTWAGHGEPTGLPEGLALYGTRGCLKGLTLMRDGGERVELRGSLCARGRRRHAGALLPHGLTDSFALAYLDWLRAIRAGDQPEPMARRACATWRPPTRSSKRLSPAVPSPSPTSSPAASPPTSARLTRTTGCERPATAQCQGERWQNLSRALPHSAGWRGRRSTRATLLPGPPHAGRRFSSHQ